MNLVCVVAAPGKLAHSKEASERDFALWRSTRMRPNKRIEPSDEWHPGLPGSIFGGSSAWPLGRGGRMDVGTIFKAAGAVKSIAHLLGVIDSLDAKVDRLVRSELNAGLRNLDQARVSEKEREHLLREARACFNKAVSLESGFRRGIALLGCATCHHLLADLGNVRPCLEELVALPPAIGLGDFVKFSLVDSGRFSFATVPEIYRRIKAMTSKNFRITETKRVVMKQVSSNSDARSLLMLQQSVAEYIGSPVRWLDDLENGRFYM